MGFEPIFCLRFSDFHFLEMRPGRGGTSRTEFPIGLTYANFFVATRAFGAYASFPEMSAPASPIWTAARNKTHRPLSPSPAAALCRAQLFPKNFALRA